MASSSAYGSEEARGNSSTSGDHGDKPRRSLIENACTACQKRKSKCDGTRPTCGRCQQARTRCIFEAEQGESRFSAVKRKNAQLEEQLERRDEWIERQGEAVSELITILRQYPEASAALRYISIDDPRNTPRIVQDLKARMVVNPSQHGADRGAAQMSTTSPITSATRSSAGRTTMQPQSISAQGLPPLSSLMSADAPTVPRPAVSSSSSMPPRPVQMSTSYSINTDSLFSRDGLKSKKSPQ